MAVLLNLVDSVPTDIKISGQRVLQSKIEDDVYIHLTFPGEVQAHLHCSWLWPERKRQLTVVGKKGMLVFDELKRTVTLHQKRIDAELKNQDEGSEVVFQQTEAPLGLELEHFLSRLKDRQRPLSDGQNGVEVIKILEKATLQLEAKMSDPTIHESAYVDPGAKVGQGTKIWHFSHIMSGATIGENCSLGQNVFVGKNVVVGNTVKIQNNVSLYEGLILEDYVFCGPSMVFTNIKTPRCAFPRNTSEDYHQTLVKKGSSIGANATIVCGITIG